MKKRLFLYLLLIIFLLIVAIAGWFATDKLGNKARQEIIGESHASILTLSTYVTSTFTITEGAVKSLSGSPLIAPALMSKRDLDIEHANSALDRYNSALKASVSYLMDADGMTVASSNRNDPDGFVGKSYRFRPYFQEAAGGKAGHYFALGITSGKMGFYASYPVQNHSGKVLGVVTMKKGLDEMAAFFSQYPFCFLINKDGIIYLSSSPAMVLKSLWPLDKAVQDTLIASQQFGNKPFGTGFFKKEIADGTDVTLEGEDYFFSRKVIDSDGDSIVLLTPTDRVGIYKLIGILAAVSVGFLILFFSGVIFLIDRSKEALRQSEEKHRLLFDSAGDAIFVVDAEARLLAVNPLVCERLGYTHAELMSMTIDQMDAPAEAQHVPDRVTRLMEEGYATFETVHQRKDGSLIPTDVIARRITWDGRPAIMSICRDITERKRAEEALRESEELFRKVFEDHAAVKLIIDPDTGKIIDANKAAVVFYGWSREQLKQMRIQDINTLSPEEVKEEMEKVRAEKRIHFEFRHRRADGSVRDVDVYSSKIEVNKRDLLHSIVYDITDRKQAEKALRESEERQRLERDRLELILKTAQDGFWLVDASTGRLVDVNEAASSMLGYTREELLARGLTDIDAKWSPEEIGREMQKIKTAGDALFETCQRTKGGQIIDVEISVNYLPATDQFFSFLRDITKRKRAEEKLLASQFLLNEMGKLANVGGWEFDVETLEQAWTEEVYRIHEVDTTYKPTVSKGFDFYAPASRPIIEQAVQRAIEDGEPFDVELEFITAKNNHRWVHAIGKSHQEHGKIKRVSGVIQDITKRRQAEEEREKLIIERRDALSEIKTLSGLLPICSSCKKIRDDSGYWNQIESYIKHHSEAEFSHSICPECAKILYPEDYKVMYPDYDK